MPTFRVRLTKTVTDLLSATIKIEADSPEAAAEKALLQTETLRWEFDVADVEGGSDPEVHSVNVIAERRATA